MLRFLIRRLLTGLPSLLGLLVITFVLVRVVPTDPAVVLAGENATPDQITEIRRQYGFDQPLLSQFALYLEQVSRLDFGESQYSRRAVALDIGQRLPATMELTIAALLLGSVFGIPLGVVAATHHNRWPDFLIRGLSIIGIAFAAFWLAIMLQLLFSMKLGWLPIRGALGAGILPVERVTGFLVVDSILSGRLDALWSALKHLALPAVTLGLGCLGTIARFARAGVLDTMDRDFVLYARAAGYPQRRLIWVYVLRNSLINVVTQIGLLFGGLISGAVVVETIFDWPGIGNYTVQGIFTADYKVVLAVTLTIGVIYILVNILVDFIHGLIDPRLWSAS